MFMYVESEKLQKSEFENVEQFAEDLRVAIENVVHCRITIFVVNSTLKSFKSCYQSTYFMNLLSIHFTLLL